MKIFLDIDGVMVHADPSKQVIIWPDGFYKFDENAVDALKLLISEDDEIIISSTHRFRFSNEEWNVMFKTRHISNKVSIMNSTTSGALTESEKLEDILLYLDHNKLKPEEVIIIDDDKRLNNLPDQWKQRLILTNGYTGLTKEDKL